VTLRAATALAALLLPLATSALSGRVAVVAGVNLGSPARARLWFAEKDAERFERALRELGDFQPDHVELQRGQGVEAFRQALARAEAKVKAAREAGEKTLLVVYYSGHAGGAGLEFGTERLSFDELKETAARSSAESRIVIVDACEAGMLTQVKGARAEARIDFALPVDDVRGTAFIASTAVGESAQESAAIGGSFFTHHLETALRGAGDADGDGLVTMAEAFRYTSSATVSATSATQTGAQHPTYDFKMSGRGDVVLADLRRAEAKLLVPIDPGSLYLLKGPRGLMAEVPAGSAELALALPAGEYAVERRAREGRARGEVLLARGETRLLPRLVPTRYEQARSKGGPLPTEWWLGAGGHLVGFGGAGLVPSIRAGLRREVGPFGLVVHADYALGDVTVGGLPTSFTRIGGGATLLYPLLGSRTLLEGGLDLGGGWNTQGLKDGRHYSTGDVTGAAALRLSMPFGRLRTALDVSGGVRTMNFNDERTWRPAFGATLLVLYGL
jgi:caspase domain-containing protein